VTKFALADKRNAKMVTGRSLTTFQKHSPFYISVIYATGSNCCFIVA